MFQAANITEAKTLDELYHLSDFITLHMPLTDETKNMISTESIGKMRNNVKIINCARGGLIDPAAVLAGLESGKIGGIGLDVFSTEPITTAVEMKIINHPLTVATPHLGASTKEAQVRCGEEISLKIGEFFINGVYRDAVNFPSFTTTFSCHSAQSTTLDPHFEWFSISRHAEPAAAATTTAVGSTLLNNFFCFSTLRRAS